jgi:hypothetical protein
MNRSYELNFPVGFLKDTSIVEVPEFDVNWIVQNKKGVELLSKEGIEFFDSIGINVFAFQRGDITLFRGNPNSEMDIHTDSGVCWCINFIWGSDSSDMIWYKETENTKTESDICTVNAPYIRYEKETMQEIERVSFSSNPKPVLLKIDEPHHVINYDDKYRWCLSIRDLSKKHWSWEQAVEFFKPYMDVE